MGRKENLVKNESQNKPSLVLFFHFANFDFNQDFFYSSDVNSLRKEHENQHEQQQQRQKSPLETNDDDDSEETKTVHIVEEIVGEEEDANEKVQAQNQIDCDYASDCSSDNHSKESLEDDMLKLCGEIDDAIGGKMSSGDNSSVDLTYREEKAFQSIIDKVKSSTVWLWLLR